MSSDDAKPKEESALFDGRGRLYRQLFDLSPSPALVHDGLTLRAINRAAADFFGFATVEDAVGTSMIDRVYPDDVESAWRQTTERARDGLALPATVVRYLRTDGTIVVGKTVAAPLTGFDEPLFHTLITDVGHETDTQRHILEVEERYRRLFELSPEPMIIHDADAILQANRAAADYMGYRAEHLVGKIPESIVHPESRLRVTGRISEMLATGNRAPRAEISFLTARGEKVVAEVSSAPVLLAGKRVIISALRDLTERRLAEDAVRLNEERFRSVVESAPMGIHLYRLEDDDRLVFVGANPAADRILGIENRRFVGKSIEEAFPALVDTLVPDAYRAVAVGGLPWSTEQVDYDDAGIVGAFEVHAFRTSELNVAVMFRDVTARRRVEHERDEYRARLEAKVRDRTDELSTVRYELDAITAVVAKAVELRDPYTAGHQVRAAQLAVRIAQLLGMDAEEIEQIRIAAVLHDIGKLSVPAEILSKPGALSAAEYALVKGHPTAAYQILCEVELDWPLAQTVLQHHERLDGSGYPQGLVGADIIRGARVLAVADVVEAISSHRPYRPSLGVDAALAEITANRGTLYDETVVDACLTAFDEGFSFE